MDGPDKALVRLEALGFEISVEVLYEDGQWALAPEPEFAKHLNKPIQELIAERKLAVSARRIRHAARRNHLSRHQRNRNLRLPGPSHLAIALLDRGQLT